MYCTNHSSWVHFWAKYTKCVIHMIISCRASDRIVILLSQLVSLNPGLSYALIKDYFINIFNDYLGQPLNSTWF